MWSRAGSASASDERLAIDVAQVGRRVAQVAVLEERERVEACRHRRAPGRGNNRRGPRGVERIQDPPVGVRAVERVVAGGELLGGDIPVEEQDASRSLKPLKLLDRRDRDERRFAVVRSRERARVQLDPLAVELEPRFAGHPLGSLESDALDREACRRDLACEQVVGRVVARPADVPVGIELAERPESSGGVHAAGCPGATGGADATLDWSHAGRITSRSAHAISTIPATMTARSGPIS